MTLPSHSAGPPLLPGLIAASICTDARRSPDVEYGVWSMREAGYITDHEVRIGKQVAYVLSGGDGPPREVSEQDILDLEREAFLSLLGTKETQARIAHTLQTGKPLRN